MIEAQNICAFKELSYTIDQGVTTLIFGDNRDNESQRSNGSGKSALIECVALGISGSALRKIKNEEIINDAADSCFVKLVFDNESAKEVFTIEREFFRKSASVIRCHVVRDGKAVESDEAVKSSVDQYNRYVLEKLGITRDELFNNFILSKHKYQDFLSCSDKDKKEIINRFSNGILVDDAIVKIEEDIVPIQNQLHAESIEFAGVDGRVQILEEQIEQEENGRDEKVRSKQEKIAGLENSITQKREDILHCKGEIEDIQAKREKVGAIDKEIQKIENSEMPVDECFDALKTELSIIGTLSDWSGALTEKRTQITNFTVALEIFNNEVADAESRVNELAVKQRELGVEHQKFVDECETKQVGYDNEIAVLRSEAADLNAQISGFKTQRRTLSTDIETLKNKIAGAIICPECAHQFLVSDSDFDVIKGGAELKEKQEELQRVAVEMTAKEQKIVEIETLESKVSESRRAISTSSMAWSTRVTNALRATQSGESDLEDVRLKQQRVVNSISSLQRDIDSMRRKMFDEAFGLIDTTNKETQSGAQNLKEQIKSFETSIDTLQSTIDELNTTPTISLVDKLKTSLKEYRAKSTEVLQRKDAVNQQLLHLQEQQGWFILFKTFLANTKIGALSKITNEFLESIGSDIRIRFSGYTVLKTGKVREKISISLIRDGIEMGSFGKLSAGEAARVNLSSILAMQKLVNSNCDTDKGLDLLILDEILDACDESGLASMFSALNSFGITALVVSHGGTAESYPHKLTVRKENGESRIEQ